MTALFAGWRQIVLAFLVPLVVGTALSFVPSPKYEATSSLLVKPGREYEYRPEVGQQSQPRQSVQNTDILRTEVEILTSDTIARDVVSRVGLARLFPNLAALAPDKAMAEALDAFGKRLQVVPLQNSLVIRVAFSHRDPQVAIQVVNDVVDTYLARRLVILRAAPALVAAAQVAVLGERLTALEADIATYRNQSGAYSVEQQRELLLRQRADIDSQIKRSQEQFTQARQKVAGLERALAGTDATRSLYRETLRDDAVTNAKNIVLELEMKDHDLRMRWRDESPVVELNRVALDNARAALTALQAERSDAVRVGVNPVHEALQTDLRRAQAELDSFAGQDAVLARQRTELDSQLAGLEQRAGRLAELLREHDVLQDSFKVRARQAEEDRMLGELDGQRVANLEVISRAAPPLKPRQVQIWIVAFAIISAVMSALAMAVLVARWRSRGFLSPEALEAATGLPVLLVLPHLGPPR